jgi:uncharacterized protein (TIGR02996 family)
VTDAIAFLRAIHAAPDDAAPRLVFADWLDEHGEPERADLIRRMIAAPSYTFFWNQCRRAKKPRHVHKETLRAICRLKGRLSAVCREKWSKLPDVERVTIRRGLAEAVTMPARPFLATAPQLFMRHPIQTITLSDFWAAYSFDRPGMFEVTLSVHPITPNGWPAVLFPEFSPQRTVFYPTRDEAAADLSRRAAGYGRRMAGVPREPPPLPLRGHALAAQFGPDGHRAA